MLNPSPFYAGELRDGGRETVGIGIDVCGQQKTKVQQVRVQRGDSLLLRLMVRLLQTQTHHDGALSNVMVEAAFLSHLVTVICFANRGMITCKLY